MTSGSARCAEGMATMLYTEWISNVLNAARSCENVRTRLVGLPVPALREPLVIADADIDAIEDAVYDLEALGLARRRPNSFFNLTPVGREAAASGIEDVCGEILHEICATLTREEASFVRDLLEHSEREYVAFARLHYVDVDLTFEHIGLQLSHEQQEAFLMPLAEKICIDYREFETDRDARPLFAGIICVGG